jgi:uncharacterized membrane protein (UPF0127 family)
MSDNMLPQFALSYGRYLYRKVKHLEYIVALLFSFSTCYANNLARLTVEIPATSAEQQWGLMGRYSLPENAGMLFIYPHAHRMNFWMFNTFIDLSIAFIDKKNIIREIYIMRAHPEIMDPKRPVKQLSDMDQYPDWGPEKTFFRKHHVVSLGQYYYALEVNAGWFERHGLKVGDHMNCEGNQCEGARL